VTRPYSGSIRKSRSVGGDTGPLSLWTSGLASIAWFCCSGLISKPDGWNSCRRAGRNLLKTKRRARHVGRDKARRLMRNWRTRATGARPHIRTEMADGCGAVCSLQARSPSTPSRRRFRTVDGSIRRRKKASIYIRLRTTSDGFIHIFSIYIRNTKREVVGPSRRRYFPAVLSGANQASACALINALPFRAAPGGAR